MSSVKLFGDIDVANIDPGRVTVERDQSLAEEDAYLNFTHFNCCMFIFIVSKILKKVRNVTENGIRFTVKTINMLLLVYIVEVGDVHTNHSLVKHVRK
jgi:hypothetical protein